MAALEPIIEEFQIGKKYKVTVNPPLEKKPKPYKFILAKIEGDEEGIFYQFVLPNEGGGMIITQKQLDEGQITITPNTEEHTAKPSINIPINRNLYTETRVNPEGRGLNTYSAAHPSIQEEMVAENAGFALGFPKAGGRRRKHKTKRTRRHVKKRKATKRHR